ncbi:S1 family peptidase [Streptomyces clavuligerus]|nr:S1 family peptidase [Streptomyces clavuligerus]AXU16704.1 S1 family peptidase [Streptomyces clavuligerus]MBY6305639.1 S1 family peptidase [Streptomyces clavuligerus]QCS09467.1 S1 family peptidase [Streptomyces clavuligerus]QPJ96569.1 trypsin-like serine protease [Streptomyces clavuligerus]QPL66757.1 S1 family peptidase [Streptomyces clavuligerus]
MTARWLRPAAVLTGLVAVAVLTAPAAAAPGTRAGPYALAAASDAVHTADVAGTAWYTDPVAGRVVLTADATVTPAALARIRSAAGPYAALLRVERAPGVLTELTGGGDRVHTLGRTCSAGFNVRGGSARYILTAGHCTVATATWYADSALRTAVGPAVATHFPGADFGLIRYDNPSVPRPGKVGRVDITGVAHARVGMSVTRRGGVSGVARSTVTGVGITVNYGRGVIVSGLIRSDVCAENGDSGSPLHSGPLAVGIVSGGTGDCATGGVTYFQPVAPALARLGVTVY